MRAFALIVALLAIANRASADGPESTFVLLDLRSKKLSVDNPGLAARPMLPCSTFKIPNTLIGLSTGVIPDESFHLVWDGIERPVPEWNRDHDLASALKYSVVWFYQEVARRIGPTRMRNALRRFDYGNQDICCAIDQFWLRGALRITARQQVDFLRRMASGRLPVSRAHVTLVRRLITLETTPEYTLQGKTGTGEQDGRAIAWLVGFVERPRGGSWSYAWLQVAPPGQDATSREQRLVLVKQLLHDRGVLP